MDQPEAFDYKSAAAELNAGEPDGPGRKLTLHDQCCAFAALRNRIPGMVVAKAFGVSRIAVSQIAGCLNSNRYRQVAREFNSMDEDAFHRKYYTENLQLRLRRAKLERDDDSSRFRRGAPTMKADKKSFRTIGAFEIDPGEWWRVSWIGHKTKPELAGWYFAACQQNGDPFEGQRWEWKGQESIDQKPFRTSGYAFNAAWAYCNREAPR